METNNKGMQQTTNAKKLDFANLSKLAADVKLSESTGTGTKEIYKNAKSLSSAEQKKFRRDMRKKIIGTNGFTIRTIKAIRSKNESELQKIYSEFMPFYKAEFLNNDFSVGSIRGEIRNEEDKKQISLFMETMKAIHETK